jgi:hypothetical protein
MQTTTDYVSVTEISGDEVSQEQVQRIYNRYKWAAAFCQGKDVVEAAAVLGVVVCVIGYSCFLSGCI